ncbi:MAG: hypothetical protein JHC95_18745, partial [Solirubrobacteraceae bacterium]|nr:hypothetical protein [Solirubrobacteraceae bacterium]
IAALGVQGAAGAAASLARLELLGHVRRDATGRYARTAGLGGALL